MKKYYIYLLTAVSTLVAVNANAQTTPPETPPLIKSYISPFAGLSSPMSDFKSSSYDNNKAGFAKNGFTFGLDGAYYFYKHLALGATLSFHDQGELTTDDATTLANGYTTSYDATGTTVTAVNRYHIISLLAGPQYTFLIGSKVSLDLRASAGVLHSTSTPEITTEVTGSSSQTETFYQRSAKQTAFGYGGNLGINYLLSDHVALTLRGAYIGSKGFNITNEDHTVDDGRLVARQPVSIIQTTLGLNFRF